MLILKLFEGFAKPYVIANGERIEMIRQRSVGNLPKAGIATSRNPPAGGSDGNFKW
jgi:hypothetical protein